MLKPKVKRPRPGLEVHFPQSEHRNLSEKVFGAQTNNRAEAMACLRVLRDVHRSCDLHVQTDSKWSYDIIPRVKRYHDP